MSFLKTFFSVFIILMFIFVLQAVWLYISELAGKDLDALLVLKFLWLYSPKIMPLVLPLSILVTSLMVFGNFAEKYEFAAMKSTGISLQRAMRSLMVFIFLLAIVAFYFANNVIPYSEYKWQNLRRNIQQFSPSMVIAEGQFTEVGDINIKVAEKYGDNDEFLKEVIIHKKDPEQRAGNYTVMVSETGELTSEEGSNTLSLILRDGNYYDEIQSTDFKKQRRKPFAKSYFEELTINIDLTELNKQDLDKDNEYSNQNMFKVNELLVEIDSLGDSYGKDLIAFHDNMYYRSGISKFNTSVVKKVEAPKNIGNITSIYPEKRQAEIIQMSLNNVRGSIQSIEGKKKEFQRKTKRINKYEIALHEKFALGVACIILFFVGAPLGAIIRKGGMGLPMVIAIVLFLTYHFIGIFAKNSAEDGTISPFIATWISTIIMLPLGIWLTYRATTDQGVFDIDSFTQRIGRIFGKKKIVAIETEEAPILLTQQEKATLSTKSEHQLKDIVKNYRQYNYSEDMKRGALRELKAKGYTEEQLKFSGDFENITYTNASNALHSFSSNSKKALSFYIISILALAGMIYFNNVKMELSDVLKTTSDILQVGSILLFYTFVIRALIAHSKFKKIIGKEQDVSVWILFLVLGPAIYIFLHFSVKKNLKEELAVVN
ncbi:LptF/LptG family permease [Jejudonia soesokkakensis]|uniref:LptF/LptG family permease n=2 Tax=Jejudonia soesokkakensis TaxID=1323432 RepID=A0ABW2MY74_9FLAO